jgi:hypothetical protein
MEKTETKISFMGKKKKPQEIRCLECNETEFTFDRNKKICVNCGLECVLYENMEMGYKDIDHININKTYTYEKICHFKDTVMRFQSKQNKYIPDKVFDDLFDMLKNHGMYECRKTKVSIKHVRDFLHELGYNKYYEDIQLIWSKITGNPTKDISHLEERLYKDFNDLVSVFYSLYNNRKNFLNSQYVLKQLLRRYHYEVKDTDLIMLKTTARIKEHDEMYEKCCEILNWNFRPL